MKIDIVIPVYNEAGNIKKNLDSIQKGIAGSSDEHTVDIVYDFEEDNTLPVVRSIQSRYKFTINLVKNKKSGVCSAIKTGFDNATGDYVLVTMADGSDDYTTLPRMADKAREGFDVVCASRYMKGGNIYGGPFVKKTLSRLAGLSLNLFTGIPTHDITNSYKLYKRAMLKNLVIESDAGFEISIELPAKAFVQGYKITEIPSNWHDRTEGKSRFKLFKWLPKYMRWYWFLLSNIFNRKTEKNAA